MRNKKPKGELVAARVFSIWDDPVLIEAFKSAQPPAFVVRAHKRIMRVDGIKIHLVAVIVRRKVGATS